jgi:LmbE family N-acetylglucosaminyl deacetylase
MNQPHRHPRRGRTRWIVASVLALLIVALTAAGGCSRHDPAVSRPAGVLNVVAHQDDDLIFLSPDLIKNVTSGDALRTIYVTAGDANQDAPYWQSREAGVKSAYARMAGVADSWVTVDAGVPGHPMTLATLTGATQISLLFMRIPDGWLDGSGGSRHDHTSLQKLYTGTIASIGTDDHSSRYTKVELVDTLVALMNAFKPATVNTLDFKGGYGDGDHSDHHTVGYLTREASAAYQLGHELVSYQGYGVANRQPNVTNPDLETKTGVFLRYAGFDAETCDTSKACANRPEGSWLPRQYQIAAVAEPSSTPAPTGTLLTPSPTTPRSVATAEPTTETAPGGSGETSNVARTAKATASSQNVQTDQTASKAINGVAVGYPQDYDKEWATKGTGTGSWLQLQWSTPVTINRVVLFDRPNADDQVTAGKLRFSDGSTVAVPTLDNSGYARTITFSSRATRTLRFTITAVSPATANIGLSEIQVWTG